MPQTSDAGILTASDQGLLRKIRKIFIQLMKFRFSLSLIILWHVSVRTHLYSISSRHFDEEMLRLKPFTESFRSTASSHCSDLLVTLSHYFDAIGDQPSLVGPTDPSHLFSSPFSSISAVAFFNFYSTVLLTAYKSLSAGVPPSG